MTDSIIAQFIGIFINVDDFCLAFEPEYNKRLLEDGTRKRIRKSRLSLSEVMTIIIWFHMSGYRTFKDYYVKEVSTHLIWAFPYLVSYNRFVELMPQALLPLCFYFRPERVSAVASPLWIPHPSLCATTVVFTLIRCFDAQPNVVKPQWDGSMASRYI